MKVLDNMPNIKQLKENYEKKTKAISIPDDISPHGIREVEFKIDTVYQEAAFDLSTVETAYRNLKRWYDLGKKAGILLCSDSKTDHTAPLIVAPDTEQSLSHKPKTAPEKEAWAHLYASSIKILISEEEIEVPIVTALDAVEELYIYLQAVIDILKEKHNAVVATLSSFKIETSFSNTTVGTTSTQHSKPTKYRSEGHVVFMDSE